MRVADLLATTKDAASVKRVFGEPIEKDGVTVIPVAAAVGGGGGGGGNDGRGLEGEGGGFGIGARPVGVYVLKDGTVKWIPAIDITRLVVTVGGIVIAALVGRRAKVHAKAS